MTSTQPVANYTTACQRLTTIDADLAAARAAVAARPTQRAQAALRKLQVERHRLVHHTNCPDCRRG